jgi:hypothetical protein
MLYLLQSFDTVCKKHDIDYWLDYGTLLGAIRHQGFIPWDTDTDVGMLRSDYALFLEKGVPELPQDIFFQTPETEPAMAPWSWLVEARLRDRHSRYVPDKKTPAEPMQFGGMYVFADGKRALKGLVMKPFEQAPWAGALQQADGLLLKSKSLFPQGLSQDVCFMKEICFSPSTEGVLLFTACNDTVAGIYANGIEPAYVLKRENR